MMNMRTGFHNFTAMPENKTVTVYETHTNYNIGRR